MIADMMMLLGLALIIVFIMQPVTNHISRLIIRTRRKHWAHYARKREEHLLAVIKAHPDWFKDQ